MMRNDLNKLDTILLTFQGIYTISQAAQKLHLTERRIKQLRNQVRKNGYSSIAPDSRKTSGHSFTAQQKEIIDMKQLPDFRDMSFLQFQNIVNQIGYVNLSYSTLYRLLTDAHIKPLYSNRCHVQMPLNYPSGTLFQLCTKPFPWLSEKEPYYLHAFLDASGLLFGLYLDTQENAAGYARAFMQVIQTYGLPETVYIDRAFCAGQSECRPGCPGNTADLLGKIRDLGISVETVPAACMETLECCCRQLEEELPHLFLKENACDLLSMNRCLGKYLRECRKIYKRDHKSSESMFVPMEDESEMESLFRCLCG